MKHLHLVASGYAPGCGPRSREDRLRLLCQESIRGIAPQSGYWIAPGRPEARPTHACMHMRISMIAVGGAGSCIPFGYMNFYRSEISMSWPSLNEAVQQTHKSSIGNGY